MIYTVECNYAEPASEAEWNAFYSLEKLPTLISVSGFSSSQRFKALSDNCPAYLALHSVDTPAVLQSDEYRQKGGGNFSRWQSHITDWRRNLYAGLDRAVAVGADEFLLLSDQGPQILIELGLTPLALHAVALDKRPAHRWLAKLDCTQAKASDLQGLDVYCAMTVQLQS
ncbi:sugar ABC transporter [Pseudomonas brassicacearum]|uniref:sugar ABC transporter n=1 Tax=Pseudomonas brassicacearum TaxID=930166 RepID=UPI000F491568|nr:sugar ABC transporter [Pseudomonas brassicacearum]ROM75608.1 sugar ABC transporter [Pseudomonas brassicacearum]